MTLSLFYVLRSLVNVVIHVDDETSILSSITRLKSLLGNILEPDFGLLDHLLANDVLTRRQIATVRSKATTYDRSDAVLDLLAEEEQCGKLITALQQTGQEHVANFITQNGGRKHNL